MTSPHRGSRKTIDVLSRAAVIYGVLIEQYDATRDELIARVRKALGPRAYGAAPGDALLRDVKWLKQLGYEIAPTEGYRYRLVSFDPLLPLPLTREDIETLAAVRKALAATLYAESIEHLVSNLRPFIQPNWQPLLEQEPLLKLTIPLRDNITQHHTTLQRFRRAREQHRQFSFLHTSPTQPELRPIRHTIEPESIVEQDGHVYLAGYPIGGDDIIKYRLDRITPESVEVLPTKFAEGRRQRLIPIRYKLSPVVASLSVTRRFANQHERKLDDGWMEVTGEADGIFWASKTLLKYGENCIVLEPPELVKEIKRVIGEMARNYGV